jgi:hypothetical protein
VDARVRVRDITRAGTSLELDIYDDGKKLGTLTLGAGSLIWRKSRARPKRVRWSKFAEIMAEQ